MNLVFEEAEAIPQTGSGRKAEPNPFTEVIAAIAMKTNEKTKKPVARAYTQEVETDGSEEGYKALDTLKNRIKRQMSEAGAANTPAVTVPVRFGELEPVKGKKNTFNMRVTFWTVKRQERPRTASAEQAESTPTS